MRLIVLVPEELQVETIKMLIESGHVSSIIHNQKSEKLTVFLYPDSYLDQVVSLLHTLEWSKDE